MTTIDLPGAGRASRVPRRFSARAGIAGLLVAAVHGAAWASDALWQRLQTEPNLIVLMRHAHARGGDPLVWDPSGRCSGEPRLTDDGRTLARTIGAAFASRGIKPVVISSPMCRCLETAQLAFGGRPASDPELREVASADAQRLQAFDRRARSLIASARGPAPVVFVSHRPNIEQLALELLDEGDLLVGRINPAGEVDAVLGKITLRP